MSQESAWWRQRGLFMAQRGRGTTGVGHTEADPFAEIAGLSVVSLDEAGLQVVAEVGDDGIHERLQSQDAAHGVVLDDGALHAGMVGLVGLAEEVVGDLAIDDGAVVVVELGLLAAAGSDAEPGSAQSQGG